MRQRVAFLRTLIAGKPVLALDEPFASLDAITRAEMQEWLAAALRTDPRTVVLVTHDVEEALYLSDRVAVLSARPAPDRRRARAPRAARRRPRRRRHRPRLRRRPRGGAAGAARRAVAMRTKEPRMALAAAGLLLAALLGLWQVACSTGAIADALSLESFLVPSPAEIASSLWENRGLLAENAWVTLREMLLGIVAALVVGVGFAVLMHLSARPARRRLPADRRLADDPDRRHRPDPGRLVRLRDRARRS